MLSVALGMRTKRLWIADSWARVYGIIEAACQQVPYCILGPFICRCAESCISCMMVCAAACRVRWYVSSLGSEDGLHTAHWHGISFNHNGMHMDQVRLAGWLAGYLCRQRSGLCLRKLQQLCELAAAHTRFVICCAELQSRHCQASPRHPCHKVCPQHVLLLRLCVLQLTVLPSTMATLDAYTDNPGTWLFHCHLNDHIQGGMMALFNVAGQKPTHNLNGKV